MWRSNVLHAKNFDFATELDFGMTAAQKPQKCKNPARIVLASLSTGRYLDDELTVNIFLSKTAVNFSDKNLGIWEMVFQASLMHF